ncbi:AAA family ATPase [Streptomyces sp. NBC_00094]|uniref:AAA family ATPase n=1 Tax=Streptomyces sp. NBC_00094 TaxID=2903620 RepID=UPI002253B9F9|nr:AAA family ATPase [Streptomyces sp. NBC_00094]MCX5389738.1 hypothetical protein [Streptomyces sp. NBC_00094]
MDGAGGANGTHERAGVDRRLVVVGTGSYRHAAGLPLADEELHAAVRLFGELGYRVDERIADAPLGETRDRLLDWAYRADRTGTAVALYWTGHGVAGPGRHYLLCSDSHPDRLAGTALAAEDLTRYVLESGAERVLLVIDTCGAGQGGADAATAAEGLRAALRQGAAGGRRLTDLAVIAVARAGEPASPMVFAAALETALARLSVSHKQRYLSVEQTVDTVNDVYRSAGIHQTARAHVETEGYAFFSFENTGYRPEARYDEGDVAELAARLARTGTEGIRRRADLETHFAPRGQGFEHMAPGRHGSYFVGRTAELDRIGHWLADDGRDRRRGLVVTGGPGVGKSALLGKLLLRSGARTAEPPAPTAIHARHRFLEDLVAGVADAAGLTADTPQALLGALAARRAPLHLIVDALDEAGEAHGDDTEARRITEDLLRPLLRVPCVRLLVGTRPHVLDAFDGEDTVVLDLDDTRESSGRDIAHYARRLLQAPDGPGSRGPYDDPTAETVAREIAARVHGSFLSARIAARYLGRAARPIDTAEPDWHARVPEVGETPGVTFLRVLRHQLGADHARGLALLAALALAEGPGLPPDRVWRTIAGACTTGPSGTGAARSAGPSAARSGPSAAFAWEDIAWLLGAAGEHLVEELDADGRSVYRLYHQAYADALRTTLDDGVRDRVARALARLVPEGPHGPDWAEAPPYVRRHLAEHAEGTELLDVLALDPEYLLTAGTSALQRVLNRATTEQARAAARAVGHCAALLHTRTDPGTRAAQLRLSAFQSGAEELAAAVRRRYPSLPWDTEWAEVAPVPYTTIGTFTGGVRGAAVVPVDGRPAVLVTAERDGPVRAWDTEGGELLAELPGDLGRITAVHGCPTRPWAALRSEERIWAWDVASRDLIGAVDVPPHVVDCALTEVGGECVVAVLDRTGTVTLTAASGGRTLLTLRADPRRHLRRPFDGTGLALERHGGRLRVAVTRGHRWDVPWRRVRLTVWELDDESPGSLTVHRELRRLLRGRTVSALALCGGTAAVATERALTVRRGRTPSTVEKGGLRVVEWAGLVVAPALLITSGPDAEPVCLTATAHAVTALDSRGAVPGRTRTDAPVRFLLPVGHGPDGLRLVSLAADAWSAKAWHLGPPGEDEAEATETPTTLGTGLSGGRPVVSVRRDALVRLLDGASGVPLDSLEDPDDTYVVATHPGAPVVRWRRPRRWRHPVEVSHWIAGEAEGAGEATESAPGPLPRVRGLFRAVAVSPSAPNEGTPRLVAFVKYSKHSEQFVGLHTGDSPEGVYVDTRSHGIRSVRVLPDGEGVVVAFIGRWNPFPMTSDDGGSDSPDPRFAVEVRSLPGREIAHEAVVDGWDVVHDLGRWPQGPVLGIVDPDGELTVRSRFTARINWPTRKEDYAGEPDVVPRPDRVRVTALRLQTRHGRPTVLTATADGGLTLFAADTTEVLHRVFLGGEILGLEWLDDERLCVHTATGVLCLRLG